MANVAHASLTGSELHEPKGVENAELGEVYVADGAGSGNWQSVGTSSFTGMIADFAAPVAPTGWLECDGSTISTSTYSALFAVMSIETTGTRTNGSPVITSVTGGTSNLRVGYYVFGTGISSGTTIVSVDSASQITLSNNASSSGTASFFVCPWLMNTGTVQLPNLTANGRFRRSRQSGTKVGDLQANTYAAHTHTYSGNTGYQSVDHVHTFSGTTGGMNANVTHSHTSNANITGSAGVTGGGSFAAPSTGAATINATNTDHGHAYSGVTSGMSASHYHAFSGTTSSAGSGSETRPEAAVFLTCVKT